MRVHVYEPGNGTRYEIAVVKLERCTLLCLVNFRACMLWNGLPGHPGYIAEKLGIELVDAEAVWDFMSQRK